MVEDWVNPGHLQDDLIQDGAPEFVRFLDVKYQVEVLIGTTRRTVREILELQEGDQIKLGRLASQDVDLASGDVRLASAEVIKVKQGIAARVTEA